MAFRLENPFQYIHTTSIQGSYTYDQKQVLFLIILQGEVSCEVDHIHFAMNHNDLLMLSPSQEAVFHAGGTNMIQLVCVKSDFLAQGANTLIGSYTCNSVLDTERDYTPLRQLLSQICINGTYSSRMRQIKTNELAYALLYYLNSYHYTLNETTDDKYYERTQFILSYIDTNYMHALSLDTLSNIAQLSTAYLSRFFKKATGKNFVDYLRDVRMKHALRALIETDQKIIDIALENGFSSATTFNRLFRRAYDVSPMTYRQLHRVTPSAPEAASETPETPALTSVLYDDRADASTAPHLSSYPKTTHYHIHAGTPQRRILPIWRQSINIGFINTLNSSVLLNQLKKAQQDIGFTYGRLEGILNPDVIPKLSNGKYNYAYFDRYIEMLLSVNMIPYLDLTNRENYYFTSDLRTIHKQPSRSKTQAMLHADTQKIQNLIRHCINTFGLNEVEKWIFEIGILHDEYLNPTEKADQFAERFKLNQAYIHELLPQALVGGFAYNTALGSPLFEDIISHLELLSCTPDFISVSIFPYDVLKEQDASINAYSMIVASSPDFAIEQFKVLKECLSHHPGITQKIFISSLGTDIINQNPVNDCCFQSSYFAKTILDFIDIADMVTYWQLSDIGSELPNIELPLYGGTGILSKDGLPKPGYLMLKNFSHFTEELIQKGNDYLICGHTQNVYTMIFINYTYPNATMDAHHRNTLTMDSVYSVFTDVSTKDVSIVLSGLPTGNYKLITTAINRQHGSLLDHMLRYGAYEHLHPEDIQNIHEMTHPQTTATYLKSEDGTLQLHLQLLPHEVRFCRLIRTL